MSVLPPIPIAHDPVPVEQIARAKAVFSNAELHYEVILTGNDPLSCLDIAGRAIREAELTLQSLSASGNGMVRCCLNDDGTGELGAFSRTIALAETVEILTWSTEIRCRQASATLQ